MGQNNSVIENLTTLTLYYCITAVPYLFHYTGSDDYSQKETNRTEQ